MEIIQLIRQSEQKQMKCCLLLSLLIVVTGHVARVEKAGLVEEARFVGLASFHFVFIKMMWDRPVGSSR